jgi:MFS family permease
VATQTEQQSNYLGNYRRVLTIPGVRTLLPLMFAARIPISATSMVLTLHVVLHLHRGYGEAGLVGAAGTIGIAVGSPLMGRVVDRLGLRPMVVITTIGYGTYWLTAWLLPYPALLGVSFVGGIVALPVMTIGRQSLAALVPEQHRKAAYSLDSISVEMAYMVGPALGVLIATRISTVAAVISLGGLMVLSGIVIYLVNPPVKAAHELTEPGAAPAVRPTRRQWLTGPLVSMLIISCAAVFVLAGTEVAMVAALRTSGEVSWTGVVTIVWCLASAVGGAVYGGLNRTPPSIVLLGLLAVLAIPVGLVGGQWWVLSLALLPSGLMCAPTIASAGDAVSRLAPATVRGEAMGLQSSAFTLGAALGAPVIGVVLDRFGPVAGYAASGVGALLIGSFAVRGALAAMRRNRQATGLPTVLTEETPEELAGDTIGV